MNKPPQEMKNPMLLLQGLIRERFGEELANHSLGWLWWLGGELSARSPKRQLRALAKCAALMQLISPKSKEPLKELVLILAGTDLLTLWRNPKEKPHKEPGLRAWIKLQIRKHANGTWRHQTETRPR